MTRIAAFLTATLFAWCAFAANADPDELRCWPQRYDGRSDGICLDNGSGGATKGPILVVSGGTEYAFPSTHFVSVHQDFIGDYLIPIESSADGAQGPWVYTETSASGTPTIGPKADYDDGAFEMALAATSEVEDATLFWDDEQNIDSDKGPWCVFRLQIQSALAAADTVSWGFMGAQNDIIESTANNAMFQVAGADWNLDVSSDDASTDDDLNDTGVDMSAATYIETMVTMSGLHGASATDVGFYYRTSLGGDWTQVLSGTTFAFGADIAAQPFVQVEKTSGTTTPDVLIDYISCSWERS